MCEICPTAFMERPFVELILTVVFLKIKYYQYLDSLS